MQLEEPATEKAKPVAELEVAGTEVAEKKVTSDSGQKEVIDLDEDAAYFSNGKRYLLYTADVTKPDVFFIFIIFS